MGTTEASPRRKHRVGLRRELRCVFGARAFACSEDVHAHSHGVDARLLEVPSWVDGWGVIGGWGGFWMYQCCVEDQRGVGIDID